MEEVGDRYVYTALDRDSKLQLCWRGQDDTFADKLFKAVAGRPTINTDGFKSYTSAIPRRFIRTAITPRSSKTSRVQSTRGKQRCGTRRGP